MPALREDLRFAIRTLFKNPAFLLVAVLSLGLGIGANTAIFSLINAVMLRLLPVADPGRLVLLTDPGSSGVSVETTQSGVRSILSYPEFAGLHDHNHVFSGMFAAQSAPSALAVSSADVGAERSARARTQLVSGEFFEVLGLKPSLGRTFTPAEDSAVGANPLAVISYGFWQREFGGDPGAVGKTIRIARTPFQIIGVAPSGFRGILVGSDTDIWVPITMQPQVLPGRDYLHPRDTLWLQVMARLSPGISRAQAEAGINVTLQQILHELAPKLLSDQRKGLFDQQIQLRTGDKGASTLRDQFEDPLLLIMGMVGLVLLIACGNVANLMLARATGRQRELGIRMAMGADRPRLIRQLLTESLLIAALGGLAGALLADWGIDVLMKLVASGGVDTAVEVHRDVRIFCFTAVVSLLTGVLFGLLPALRATRLDVSRTLSANARGSIGGRGTVRTGRALVVAQVALSLLLLMGATLFVRSLQNLSGQPLGFHHERLLLARVDPTGAGYSGASVGALHQRLREQLLHLPGVRGVTMSNAGLFAGDAGDRIELEGTARRTADELRSGWTLVGPAYFSTLGIPLLRGREVNETDAARGSQVCVVNEAFAKYFFPDSDPIGKHVTDAYPTTRETYEIVGVAADAREHQMSQPDRQRFYANLAHPIGTVEGVTYLIAGAGDPAILTSAVRHAIAEVDRNLPLTVLRTADEQIDQRLATRRLVADLAAFFGGLALVMAAVGLYGVMSYAMSRRTSEIGIRMALGASERGVLRMVLAETLRIVGLGVGVGLPCALVAGRLLSSQWFGLSWADPGAIGLALATIFATTLAAGFVPARRAARIDPMHALRND